MKKLMVVVLMVIVVLGAALATERESLTISLSISSTAPAYSLYGGKTLDEARAKTDGNGSSIGFGYQSFGTTTIDVFLSIWQNNDSRFTGPSTLKVTATELSTELNNVAYSTRGLTHSLVNTFDYAKKNVEALTVAEDSSSTADSAIFNLSYSGLPVRSREVANLCYTWTVGEDLPVGDYQASITLECTIA